MLIELQNINLTYNPNTALERVVLEDVSMKIEQGKFVALIGNNGAGKSTLIKIIAGEEMVTNGKILIDGKDYTGLRDFSRANLISRVFQDPSRGTVKNLSVLENLLFASKRGLKRNFSLALKNNSREFFKRELQALNCGLEEKLDIPVYMLSGGQKQILSLLMAVLSPAKILLLDEHTSALDPEAAKVVMGFTHQLLKNHNIATIMITHDMRELEHCDEVYVVSNCKVKKIDRNFT